MPIFYQQTHLLWQLHHHGPDDIRALARAVLDGDQSLSILTDTLEDRGHPAGAILRSLDAPVTEDPASDFPLMGHLAELDAPVRGVAVSPEGGLLSAAVGSELREWHTADAQLARAWRTLSTLTAVCWSPNGKGLAACCDNGVVLLREKQKTRFSVTLDQPVSELAFSSDGLKLSVADQQGHVHILSADGSPLGLLATKHGRVRGMAFACDDTRLVSAGEDGCLRWWDVLHDEEAGPELQMQGPALSCAISSDGACLVGVSPSEGVALWDLTDNWPPQLRGQQCELFSPAAACFLTAEYLAVGHWGGVSILDLGTGRVVRRLHTGQGEVTSLAFAPHGNVLIAGCWDGVVRWWNLQPLLGSPEPVKKGRRRRS